MLTYIFPFNVLPTIKKIKARKNITLEKRWTDGLKTRLIAMLSTASRD